MSTFWSARQAHRGSVAHGPADGLATAKALDLLWFCDVLVLTSAIPVRKIHAFSTQGFFQHLAIL
jgi:hypothetical protein